MDTIRQDEFWEGRLRQTIRDAESDAGAQAWDTPSEAVWEQVSEALEKKRRRIFPLFLRWGSLAAVLLLTIGGVWMSRSGLFSAPGQQADKMEGVLQNIKSPKAPLAAEDCPPVPMPDSRPKSQYPVKQTGKAMTDPFKDQQTTALAPPVAITPPELPGTDSFLLLVVQPENTIHTASLPFDPLAAPDLAPLTTSEQQETFAAMPLASKSAAVQWWFGLHGGPVYGVNSVNARQPGALLFRQQEVSQWSSERGLRLKMVLPSGWYAQAGISRYSMRQRASQVFRLRFERARERQLPSGEWESTFALSVPSSYGDTEAELDLRRDDSNPLQEGQVVVVETESIQALRYSSYQLGSGFLKSSGRWQYGAGGGIALNVLQEREFNLTAQSRQNGIRLPGTRVRRSFSEASDHTVDLQLSATVGYRISSRWMVGIEPTLRHSLSPVVRHSGFSTAATAAGIQMSVHYLL